MRRNYIIIRLIGGLGNQLFQYAFGRAISERYQVPLLLDVTGFDTYKLHSYALSPFKIQGEIATTEQINALTWKSTPPYFQLAYRQWQKMLPLNWKTLVFEPSHVFHPELLQLQPPKYFDGYWQSEKYFSAMAEELRNDLQLQVSLSAQTKRIAKDMKKNIAVSLHIRRADYVTDKSAQQTFYVCGLDYYQRAISYLSKKIEQPTFYIFSDDMEWAKSHLKLTYPTVYVDHNGADRNYEDLYLMSHCQHHIIANSTFSWWGAWLNSSSTKIVIAPKKWFKSTYSSRDLIPKKWIQL